MRARGISPESQNNTKRTSRECPVGTASARDNPNNWPHLYRDTYTEAPSPTKFNLAPESLPQNRRPFLLQIQTPENSPRLIINKPSCEQTRNTHA
mmetsp:Transcript_18522/g.40069  ORF Transcript_18522/g.40069 Transcript_18522/m.40069 type:complete len:95 (+) Transcript_18522:3202-3486(+)